LYCTLLAQAQSDTERQKIEEQMSQDTDLSAILKQLRETERGDIVKEERARKQVARQSRLQADLLEAMDTDQQGGVSASM
jgi:pre-mRNA-splicing helicase BRR2